MDRDDKILAYLQGKMASKDLALFESEMAADKSLAAEVGLMRSVTAEMAKGPKMPDPDKGWEHLSAVISGPARPANENRPPWQQWLKYAAVACLAVTTWQVVAVPRQGSGPEPFRAASEASDTFTLQVKFADTATVADVTALLSTLGATISDGPSALGIMRVSFKDDELRQQALLALEAQTDLVEFALEQ